MNHVRALLPGKRNAGVNFRVNWLNAMWHLRHPRLYRELYK
jgi:hypothetical protein